MTPQLERYEHQPSTIIPLLEHHLPASISTYGALISPSPPPPHDFTPRVWSTIPPTSGDHAVSFESCGTVIVYGLPGGQVRLFDTSESKAELDSHSAGVDDDGRRLEEGRARVVGALKSFFRMVGEECKMVGGLHEYWAEAVKKELGDGIERTGCGIWFPPKSLWESREGSKDARVDGYEVDIGRVDDIEEFASGSDIARDPAYYTSRLPWSTVIRPLPSSSTTPNAPVCRVLTHPDGSIGTLSTHPEHRRKCLAQWVVKEHIASGRGLVGGGNAKGKTAYAVVFDKNTPSQRMFAGMGWERGWGCWWVGIGHGEEGEEARRRAREVEGIKEGLRGTGLVEKNTLEGR